VYEIMSLWSRKNDYLVRYVVLRRTDDEMYSVQSSDFFYPPFPVRDIVDLKAQVLELLFEVSDADRDWQPSLGEAIRSHDEYFR